MSAMEPAAALLNPDETTLHGDCIPSCITNMPSKRTQKSPSPRNSNDAQNLLLLQEQVHKMAHAQETLEEIRTVLHQNTLLSTAVTAKDHRDLRTACLCLQSLRIRAEASLT